MSVEPLLNEHSGDQTEIMPFTGKVLRQQVHEPVEDSPPTMFRFNCQQPDLTGLATRREVAVEVRQLVIQGEWPLRAPCHHPDHAPLLHTDPIGVLLVKLVDEPSLGIWRMLGDLFDEGAVVEAMDLGELPFRGRQPEMQSFLGVHGVGFKDLSLKVPRR